MATRASSSSDKTAADGHQQKSSTQTLCWSWSIRPLLIWIRILGVNLPDVSNRPVLSSRRYGLPLRIYGVICLLLHSIGEMDILIFLHYKRTSFERAGGVNYGTATAFWNTIIDFTNYAVHALGIHVMLATVIRKRWIDLTETFQRSSSFVFTDENYVRLRRMSFFGVAYVILLISGLEAAAMGYHLTMGTSSRHRLFISFMSTFSIIYPLTALLVFAVHCYASSLTFELILNWPIEEPVDDDVVLFAAQTLGKRHVSACETVDAINHCFGWMLLLSTTFYFVAVVNATFYLVGLDNPKITLLDIIFFLFALVHLTFLCFAADHIRVKAQCAMKELLKLKSNESSSELRTEMEYLLSDMGQTLPRISANGYFDVSKKLFPQVIGTTLSYLFILYQFESSEKLPSSL